MNSSELIVKSPSFENNGLIPIKHTGFDLDISPEFQLINLDDKTISVAIIMDDLDIRLFNGYNHWVIWNIPKTKTIPENIEYGPIVSSLGGAIQGIGYGKNRYRGPLQPFFIRSTHRYIFRFYALDCFLDLDSNSRKTDLIKAMSGHILQSGTITGEYKRGSKL